MASKEVNVGTRVIYDGKKVVCQAKWAMGKHYKYVFTDGREFHGDMSKLIAGGRVTVIGAVDVTPLDKPEAPKPDIAEVVVPEVEPVDVKKDDDKTVEKQSEKEVKKKDEKKAGDPYPVDSDYVEPKLWGRKRKHKKDKDNDPED